jgi:hypothetical protein
LTLVLRGDADADPRRDRGRDVFFRGEGSMPILRNVATWSVLTFDLPIFHFRPCQQIPPNGVITMAG